MSAESSDFMRIALDLARENLGNGELPVGAVLTIDGDYIGKASNTNMSNGDWNSHAETKLIGRYSGEIYEAVKLERKVDLYTTWEPCLMCMGTSVLNRVSRIIYACPDPRGGATGMDPRLIGAGYSKIWPEIIFDERFKNESIDMLLEHMMPLLPRWDGMVKALSDMGTSWGD